MNWNIREKINENSKTPRPEQILEKLYLSRGLDSQNKIETFLNPPHPDKLSMEDVGIDPTSISSALERIKTAVESEEKIAIYGDYDADGITATAILWLALHSTGAKVQPFIPERERHGYGLSVLGVSDLIKSYSPSLIITVDNGIVANEAADYVSEQSIDLIITDHHQRGETLPNANVIVHTDKIAGSGVAWFLAREIIKHFDGEKITSESLLDLLTIGTVADLMPMIGPNRSLVKHGLSVLTKTQRPGIAALKKEAGLEEAGEMTTYHIGYVIAPRINAMGRIEHGLNALRLLCTKDSEKAKSLSSLLGDTNRTRQELTTELVEQAESIFEASSGSEHNIIVIDHEDFHEGVIGLIAGRLAEKYYKPTIVISRSKDVSKASARSVAGINIIELIRTHQDLLLGAGGHPGAAGFSVSTTNIEVFRTAIIKSASAISPELLSKTLNIDCQLSLSDLTKNLYKKIKQFEPHGMINEKPIFTANAKIEDFKLVGKNNEHLKLVVSDPENPAHIYDAIGFRMGSHDETIKKGGTVDIAFNLDENTWNGRTKLQLILKDIRQ